MERTAFRMHLKPGFDVEYQKRHNEIWPELKKLFKDAGIYDYSIFWDAETNYLFAIKHIEKSKSRCSENNEIIKKWWAYMADIMDVNHDDSPISVPLKEVFYME